jgi:hypothetical protein
VTVPDALDLEIVCYDYVHSVNVLHDLGLENVRAEIG